MDLIKTTPWGKCLFSDSKLGVKEIATFDCAPIVLQNIINFLVGFAGIVAVFFVIWAGIQFVRSEGDKEKIINARKTLTYALVGLMFVGLSFMLLSLVSQFTGAQNFTR